MSNKMGAGQGAERKVVFLSAHRCPEDDLLPHRDSGATNKLFDVNNISRSEQNYMDLSPTYCYNGERGEEEEGGVSDWSEEDLSLHFSPSVDLLSDDEDSGPESSFECVDVTVEMQVNGEKSEGSKMVPKRQIHLRKKKDENYVIQQETLDKAELALKDGSVGQERGKSQMSAYHCPHLLLRQQSTPITSTTSSDVISCGVYRGLTRGGLQAGLSEGQRRLQKSFSLDESKTKMASCVIRSVLLKKMRVEQNSSDLKKNPHVLPVRPRATEQQKGMEWSRTGVVNDLVPVMGDDRVSIKKTCSSSLPKETKTPDHKLTCFTASGHSSTYQEVLGIKGQTTSFLSKLSDRKQSDTNYCPIPQQRRGSDPITSKVKVDDTPVSQSEKTAVESHLLSFPKPTTPRLPQQTQVLPSVQEQTSSLGVSSKSAPGSSQTIDTRFYKSPTLHPHMDKISYVQRPPSPSQIQVQPTQPATTQQLHTRSQDQIRSATKSLEQIIKVYPLYVIKSTEDQEEHGGKVMAKTQQQQQQLVCSIQSFLPAQVCGNVLTSSQGAMFSGTVPSHVPIDLTSRQCFYVDIPLQLESKMLLDPETGQFVQVFLPRHSSSPCGANPTPTITNPSPTLIHTARAKPTSAVLQVVGANLPMSVMQLQPMAAVSSLYAPLHLPFALHMPTVYKAQ